MLSDVGSLVPSVERVLSAAAAAAEAAVGLLTSLVVSCDVMTEKRVIDGIAVAKHRNCRNRGQRRTAGRLTT